MRFRTSLGSVEEPRLVETNVINYGSSNGHVRTEMLSIDLITNDVFRAVQSSRTIALNYEGEKRHN